MKKSLKKLQIRKEVVTNLNTEKVKGGSSDPTFSATVRSFPIALGGASTCPLV